MKIIKLYHFRFLLGFFCLLFVSATFAEKELVSKSLLGGKIQLKIPAGFELMEEELMKLKYPSERRPTIVYTNKSGGINVALNLTQHKADQNMIEPYKDSFITTFRNVHPSAEWKSTGVATINGRRVGFLEMITPAIDARIYNLIFFSDLDGQLLLCTFNCTQEDIPDWEPLAKEIMNSLKVK